MAVAAKIEALRTAGWAKFSADADLEAWAAHVAPIAVALSQDPSHRADWLRHGGTWFAGVNILSNDAQGRVQQGPKLRGAVIDCLTAAHGPMSIDRGQISVTYPGYPAFDGQESPSAHRYRVKRAAAHVDGLLATGPERRRFLHEPHQYVLGIPLGRSNDEASPLVIWEGSQRIIRAAFKSVLDSLPVAQWGAVDLTDIYHQARKDCFEQCPRKSILAQPGESYVLHRLALHGIAPWGARGAGASGGAHRGVLSVPKHRAVWMIGSMVIISAFHKNKNHTDELLSIFYRSLSEFNRD
jgi:hypothetical protein